MKKQKAVNKDHETNDVDGNRYLPLIFVILVLTVIVCIVYLPGAHDMRFHIYRIGSIADNLKWNGLRGFPYRIYTTSFYGYGYGAPLFYGDIFLYFPAILTCMGIDIYLSYRIFTAVVFSLAFAAMYGSVRSLQLFAVSKTNDAFAVFAAMFYVYSPGFMENVWIRAAVGETLASIFLPIVFCMIYKITVQPDWKFCHVLWLSIGISGLILSHVITTIIAAFFSILFLVLHVKCFLSAPDRIRGLLLGGFFAFCLTAYWTLPFLEQYTSANLSDASLAIYVGETIQWKYWLIPYDLYRKLTEILNLEFVNQWSPSSIGYGTVFMLYLICRFHRDIEKKEVLRYGIFAFIMLGLISIKPFNQWTGAKLSAYKIQFPWRIFMMIFFLTALTLSYLLICLHKKNLIIIVSAVVLAGAGIPTALLYRSDLKTMSQLTNRAERCYDPNYADDLYLPIEVNREEIRLNQGNVFSNNPISFQAVRDTGSIHILVAENEYDNTVLNVPFIYYKGYRAEHESTGKPYAVEKSSQGYVNVDIGNDTGHVIVYYNGTKLQKISNYISMVSGIQLFLYTAMKLYKTGEVQ